MTLLIVHRLHVGLNFPNFLFKGKPVPAGGAGEDDFRHARPAPGEAQPTPAGGTRRRMESPITIRAQPSHTTLTPGPLQLAAR